MSLILQNRFLTRPPALNAWIANNINQPIILPAGWLSNLSIQKCWSCNTT